MMEEKGFASPPFPSKTSFRSVIWSRVSSATGNMNRRPRF